MTLEERDDLRDRIIDRLFAAFPSLLADDAVLDGLVHLVYTEVLAAAERERQRLGEQFRRAAARPQ